MCTTWIPSQRLISLIVPAHFGQNKMFSFSYYTVKHNCPQKHQRAFLDHLCVQVEDQNAKAFDFMFSEIKLLGLFRLKR